MYCILYTGYVLCILLYLTSQKKFQVQAVTVHATNNYFVTASLDGTWCFYDLSSGLCLTQVIILHSLCVCMHAGCHVFNIVHFVKYHSF